MSLKLEYESLLPHSAQSCFDWHLRPFAFERLTPPWEDISVIQKIGVPPELNSEVELRQKFGPFGLRWTVKHTEFESGRRFVDQMLSGPFSEWRHEHEFKSIDNGCLYRDQITCSLPMASVSHPLAGWFVKKQLERLFAYRHTIVKTDLKLMERYRHHTKEPILLTGASGLIGKVLKAYLVNAGHSVRVLQRRKGKLGPDEFYWNPEENQIDVSALEGVSTVIHLAGAPIADKRWTVARKRVIQESRVDGTRLLVDAILGHGGATIKDFISASAIGYYGDTGQQVATEDNKPYSDLFVSTSTRKWEEESLKLEQTQIRSAQLRFGVVLSPAGGALKKMLLPFLLGGGGKIGDGKQLMSWISIDDVLGAILHVLYNRNISGPVNFAAPEPTSNEVFSRTLAKVLRRPCIFPLPAPVVRLVFGQLGEELLLASVGVRPKKLVESGYQFLYPRLEDALAHQLGRVAVRT